MNNKPGTFEDLDEAAPLEYDDVYVKARIEEAAETLKRLPRQGMSQKMTTWPDVVISTFEMRGWGNEKARLGPPSAKAITRMDECLEWLMPLNGTNRRLVWARACKIPWRRLEDADGRSAVTLRKHHQYALEAMANRLNQL